MVSFDQRHARLFFRVLAGALGLTFLGLVSLGGGSIATTASWLIFGAATSYVALSGKVPSGLR